MKKKDNYVLMIIISLILISILGLLYFKDKDNSNSTDEKTKYTLLNDYSRFFTIDSCIYKYISYLSSGDSASVLKILDSNYVKQNQINENNLYEFIDKLDGNYTYKSKKIYFVEIDKNYISYYVDGYLMQDLIDEDSNKTEMYFIVNLDLKNNLFSITPYDGKIFEEGI